MHNLINITKTEAATDTSNSSDFTGTVIYNNVACTTISYCVARANATVVVTPYPRPSTTYTGLPHTAGYTLSGVNGESGPTVGTVDVSHTTHTDAGTYAADYWFFTGGANYNNMGNTTISDCIAKATATVVVTPYTCPSTTYTGLDHTASYTINAGNNGAAATTVAVEERGTRHNHTGTTNTDHCRSTTATTNYNHNGVHQD